MKQKFILLILLFLLSKINYGQSETQKQVIDKDSSYISQFANKNIIIRKDTTNPNLVNQNRKNRIPQKDMLDIVRHIFHPNLPPILVGDREKPDTRKHFSVLPAVGYSLQTGFAGLITGNMAFYSDTMPNTKISSVTTSITYSQYSQVIVPLQVNLWTKGNSYNFITDFRFISYPSNIYGLGEGTDPNIGYGINFTGIKFHQTVMKSLSNNLYAGVGYYFDHFFNIRAQEEVPASVSNGIKTDMGNKETASGFAFRLLYDSRLNQINPQQGVYYNVTFRSSEKVLGSDSNWTSLQIDSRAYAQFPKGSRNVLAFWMFDWITAGGTPPYLLLPSTGWDDYYNTGRGYIQARFRGKTMTYFETEYRYRLSRNGLIGGVAFVNAETFSSDISSQYSKLYPGYGIGLRIKANKFSDANICIDYGFGKAGSGGFFVNIGEVF